MFDCPFTHTWSVKYGKCLVLNSQENNLELEPMTQIGHMILIKQFLILSFRPVKQYFSKLNNGKHPMVLSETPIDI